uniref:RNA-directed RNA polymerase n=1 Tax=Hemipteran tombus-related virus TaxID=2822554 RepID=A0A8A6RRP7_9TOMB|nr:RNA-dependent RNA polymerase [Hemipteran tombus-related virus]
MREAAVCCKDQPLQPLRRGSTIKLMQGNFCSFKTSLAVTNSFNLAYQVGIHASCVCNEIVSLHNRHMLTRNEGMCNITLKKCFKYHRSKYINQYIPPATSWQIINNYSGAKRQTYVKAFQNLIETGFLKKYAHISMFVKPDRIKRAEIAAKAPRAIQARKPEFNLSYARFLHPIEKFIYAQPGTGPTKLGNFAKTYNNVDRAVHIFAKWSHFKKPVALNIDHSKFDSTIAVPHLRHTHSIYRKFNSSRHFSLLMQHTIDNVGFTKHGLKYKIRGTRMSGDYDTGLGNSLINEAVLLYVFRNFPVEVYIDGDDSVVIFEEENLKLVDFSLFKKLGFDTKVEVAHHIEQIEFCQCRMVVGEKPYLARNPFRSLSHLSVSLKHYTKNIWPHYNEARFFCEAFMNNGIPIMGPICYKSLQNITMFFDEDTRWMAENLACTDLPYEEPTLKTRISYQRAWGISVEDQITIESEYNTVDKPLALIRACCSIKTKKFKNFQYANDSLYAAWTSWRALGRDCGEYGWDGGSGCL